MSNSQEPTFIEKLRTAMSEAGRLGEFNSHLEMERHAHRVFEEDRQAKLRSLERELRLVNNLTPPYGFILAERKRAEIRRLRAWKPNYTHLSIMMDTRVNLISKDTKTRVPGTFDAVNQTEYCVEPEDTGAKRKDVQPYVAEQSTGADSGVTSDADDFDNDDESREE